MEILTLDSRLLSATHGSISIFKSHLMDYNSNDNVIRENFILRSTQEEEKNRKENNGYEAMSLQAQNYPLMLPQ